MIIYIPNGINPSEALPRTTHLSVAAHPDDIEIMSYHGILECFERDDRHFTGVVVTNGSGSPKSGVYANLTPAEIIEIRREEQKETADIGRYNAQIFLNYPSPSVKTRDNADVSMDLKKIISETRPEYIYTHNPADKHETHVGVAVTLIKALRELDYKPAMVYGCEVWRDLDWMSDAEKLCLDVGGNHALEKALLGVFKSQICSGKRYDLGTIGRRRANAAFAKSHDIGNTDSLTFAMDLTPLIKDKSIDICEFLMRHIDEFKNEVMESVNKFQ